MLLVHAVQLIIIWGVGTIAGGGPVEVCQNSLQPVVGAARVCLGTCITRPPEVHHVQYEEYEPTGFRRVQVHVDQGCRRAIVWSGRRDAMCVDRDLASETCCRSRQYVDPFQAVTQICNYIPSEQVQNV